MNKNELFFNNKTYKEILEELNFQNYLNSLEKKFSKKSGKKIIIYGAGILFDFIEENFDLYGLNIDAVADKRFETNPVALYKKYRALSPKELIAEKPDIVLIANNYPVKIKQYLEKNVFASSKKPKIYFLLNKPLKLYLEEIFS